MDTRMARDMWGSLALRGMAAILFGVAAVFWPGLTLVTLVYLFSGLILISGIITLVMGLTNMGNVATSFVAKILAALLGIAEIAVGVYLLRHPLVTFGTFILIVGFVLIARGVVEIWQGIFEEGSAMFKTGMILGGLLALIVGVVVLMQPASAGVAFVWILGLYALLMGPIMVALALDLKNNPQVATVRTRK